MMLDPKELLPVSMRNMFQLDSDFYLISFPCSYPATAKSLSRVRLCATPWTAAHQTPPSLGFSRQEHWSGVPFPSPMHDSEKESEVVQSCPTLCDPMDCSPPGSSVHGIFQARALEWGAIAFSCSCSTLRQNVIENICNKVK